MAITYSVLIPVYNAEDYLVECIHSVLKQTYMKFELILINDGSTDSSGSICDQLAEQDHRIRVYHQINQGTLLTRRYAISKAKGDFCLSLDADDYWDDDLLETINEVISTYDCDMVIYNYKRVAETGEYLSTTNPVFGDGAVFNDENKAHLFKGFISGKLNTMWSKAFRLDIKDDTYYTEFVDGIRVSEDLLQSIPLMYHAKKVVYIDKPLYNYRILPTSISHRFNVNGYKEIAITRGVLLEYIKKLHMDSEDNLLFFYKFYIRTILYYIITLVVRWENKEEIIEIFHEIKNSQLYVDALNYVNICTIPFKYKTLFFLFNEGYYKLLFLYIPIINFIRGKIK